jgi:predicted TIM-barrel fold metal-dependent hydrolase
MIDAHSHMLMDGDESGTKRRCAEDLTEIDFPKLFDRMDELGIERTVSVVQETRRIWKKWTGTNDLIVDLQAKYPDRFIGIFGAEPMDERNVFNRQRLLEFRAAARDHGIRGLWFGPPYGHYCANDKSAYPFYEAAVEFDAVVYYHHGGGIGGAGGRPSSAPMKYAQPLLLDDVVIDFPDLRINVEHMAYPWTEELFALMKRAEHVYADVSELFNRPTMLAWYLTTAREYGVIERIVWGSDTDIYWHDDWDFSHYSAKVERETSWIRSALNDQLESSGWPTLTAEEIEGILGENAKRLLNIV